MGPTKIAVNIEREMASMTWLQGVLSLFHSVYLGSGTARHALAGACWIFRKSDIHLIDDVTKQQLAG